MRIGSATLQKKLRVQALLGRIHKALAERALRKTIATRLSR
jgi:hypothetical protein